MHVSNLYNFLLSHFIDIIYLAALLGSTLSDSPPSYNLNIHKLSSLVNTEYSCMLLSCFSPVGGQIVIYGLFFSKHVCSQLCWESAYIALSWKAQEFATQNCVCQEGAQGMGILRGWRHCLSSTPHSSPCISTEDQTQPHSVCSWQCGIGLSTLNDPAIPSEPLSPSQLLLSPDIQEVHFLPTSRRPNMWNWYPAYTEF